MIGNFSSIFLTSMDRWFVKFFLTNADFAAFSFAVSMEGFITIAISPFTVTLFNYFCQEWRIEQIKKMHNYILLFATFIVSAAFPVKFILEVWLTEYIESTSVLFYLFASQILFIIIKSIYVNLYKARQQQTKYFVKLLIVLGSGAVFSLACYSIMLVKEAMAMGTLLSSVLWFVLCQFDFEEIIYDWKHYLFLIVSIISFVTFGNLLGSIQGFILYLLIYITSGILLIRKDVIEAVLLVKNILLRKK